MLSKVIHDLDKRDGVDLRNLGVEAADEHVAELRGLHVSATNRIYGIDLFLKIHEKQTPYPTLLLSHHKNYKNWKSSDTC